MDSATSSTRLAYPLIAGRSGADLMSSDPQNRRALSTRRARPVPRYPIAVAAGSSAQADREWGSGQPHPGRMELHLHGPAGPAEAAEPVAWSQAAAAAAMVHAEARPAEVGPAEADRAEADPAEADPAEADPAEADPAEADPAEADPAEADPAGADRMDAGQPDSGLDTVGQPAGGPP